MTPPTLRIENERLERAIPSQPLDIVDVQVDAVVSGAGNPLGVLVGEVAAEGEEDHAASEAFRREEVDAVDLAVLFLLRGSRGRPRRWAGCPGWDGVRVSGYGSDREGRFRAEAEGIGGTSRTSRSPRCEARRLVLRLLQFGFRGWPNSPMARPE